MSRLYFQRTITSTSTQKNMTFVCRLSITLKLSLTRLWKKNPASPEKNMQPIGRTRCTRAHARQCCAERRAEDVLRRIKYYSAYMCLLHVRSTETRGRGTDGVRTVAGTLSVIRLIPRYKTRHTRVFASNTFCIRSI